MGERGDLDLIGDLRGELLLRRGLDLRAGTAPSWMSILGESPAPTAPLGSFRVWKTTAGSNELADATDLKSSCSEGVYDDPGSE